MLKRLILFNILLLLFSVSLAQWPDSVYTLNDLYSNPALFRGDTVNVLAYFSTPTDSLLLDNYFDMFKKQPFPPLSIGKLVGTPPREAWYGGLLIIRGRVSFVRYTDGFWPQDTIMVYLSSLDIRIVIEGDSTFLHSEIPFIKDREHEIERHEFFLPPCDSCKFALFISGGVDTNNNTNDFWLDLEEMYRTKINSEGYCPENIFVNFFNGVPKADSVIDTSKVTMKSATLANIRSNSEAIARKIAECKRKGKKAEFQKHISNHGTKGPPPGVCLLGKNIMTKDSLFKWEQMIIDSGCTRMIDVFTQCYGGYMIDTLRHLNPRGRCRIDLTSAVDKRKSWGPTESPHRFRKAFLDSMKNGHSPNQSAVESKLNYDKYIKDIVLPYLHKKIKATRDSIHHIPPRTRRDSLLAKKLKDLENDSTQANSSICESPIVRIVPMTKHCELETVWVPPGGQLIIEFKGDSRNCANITVWQDSVGDLTRATVWNFNLRGGGRRRVINGKDGKITKFIIHNDDSAFSMITTSSGKRTYPVTPDNRIDYAGASFGGINDSPGEFGYFIADSLIITNADAIGFRLRTMPAVWGSEGVRRLLVKFYPEGWSDWWSDMEVFIAVNDVYWGGNLNIKCEAAAIESVTLRIDTPGIYTAHLGRIDFTTFARGGFEIVFDSDVIMEIDAWSLTPVSHGEIKDVNYINCKPYDFTLHQNYPEPFNTATYVTFDILEDTKARLEIIDVTGRIVKVPFDRELIQGHYSIRVDMSDLPSGIYIYKLSSLKFTRSRRMTLIK